jgi:hypothetical protein
VAVDYGQVVKRYGRGGRPDGLPGDHRYEPPRDPFITRTVIAGVPDAALLSTSLVERQNWTMRGGMRRLTRLSNGFSHKKACLDASAALWFAYYNFARVHETIRVTPAMEAGITSTVWSIRDLVELALAEPVAPPPEPKPLAPREGGKSAARELPGGRGWLRVLDGGKGGPGIVSAPGAPRLATAPPVEEAPRKMEQLELFHDEP